MEPTPQTVHEWTTLLERAAADRVVPALDRVGGIEQYIKAVTHRALDPSTARVMRDAALDGLISRETLTFAAPHRTLNFLDLAAAFKPKHGVGPVSDFARRHLRSAAVAMQGVLEIDFRLRALQVLEAYYPMPHLEVAPAYSAYLGLLRQYATLQTYAGYALARLLELNSATLRDPIATSAVRAASPTAIGELVNRILTFNLDTEAKEQLTELYNIAVATNQLDGFVTGIQLINGVLQNPTIAPTLVIEGRSLALHSNIESQAYAVATLRFGPAMLQFAEMQDDEDR